MSLQTKDYEGGAAPGWMIWAALWVIYIVWGSTYLAIRVTVETLPPFLSAGARFFVAGVIVYAVLALRRGLAAIKITKKELGASALVGAALLFGGNGLVSLAEQEVSSSLAALIIATVPLWVILLRTVTGEKVSRGTLVGVAIGFAGVAMLVLPGGDSDANVVGLLTLVVASLSWASGSFFSSRLPLPRDPFVSTAAQMVTGGLVLIVVGTATGEFSGLDPSEFSGASMSAFAYLVTVGSLFAFTCYVWLLQNAPISKVATYAYVNPVIAIFLGWLILSESITSTILIGAAVIVSSVAFIVSKESGSRKAQPEADDADAPAEAALAGASAD